MGKHRAPGTQSSAHPWLRRITAGLSITTLLLTALSGGAVYALSGLGKNIGTVDTSTLEEKYRPKAVVQTDTSPMNLLIMGSDSREGDGNDAYGSFGGARSDTTLLVHLYKGRKDAVVVLNLMDQKHIHTKQNSMQHLHSVDQFAPSRRLRN